MSLKVIRRQWRRIQEALRLLATLIAQECRLRFGFNPLGNHDEPEIMRHRNERADNRSILCVVADLQYEAAVNLDSRQG